MKEKTNRLLEQKGWSTKLVPLGKMYTKTRHAQRQERSESRIDYIVSNFDIDKLRPPTLNERSPNYFYIIDGDHRIEAVKRWLGEGWEVQQIECQVYNGLTESEEAEMFLSLNDALNVKAMDKYRVGVFAGRPTEGAVDNVVKSLGLKITNETVPGAIGAVNTTLRVYRRSNADTLRKTLRVIYTAYGDPGLNPLLIDGIGHLCQRYNGVIDEPLLIKALAEIGGGVNGLLGKAAKIHEQLGETKAQCVAAAAVEIVKLGKGGRRIPSWWKDKGAA